MSMKDFLIQCANNGMLLAEVRKVPGYESLAEPTYRKLGGRASPYADRKSSVGVRSQQKLASVRKQVLEGFDIPDLDKLLHAARGLRTGIPPHLVALWSAFGDAHIGHVGVSFTYTETHSFAQAPYIWAKGVLLGDLLSSYFINAVPRESTKSDATISCRSISSPLMREVHTRFYSETGVKDVMREDLYSDFTLETLAWWIMDDGSRRGDTVDWVVGYQEHYTIGRALRVCSLIHDRLGIPVTVHEDRSAVGEITSYTFVLPKDHLPRILPYVHPNLAYKFTDYPEDCGAWWPKDLLSKSHALFSAMEHPYLAGSPEIPHDLLITSLVSRTRARGFPFPAIQEDEIPAMLETLKGKRAVISNVGEVRELSASQAYGKLPSLFFPGRYCVRSFGKHSPMDVFRKKLLLAKVIEAQVLSGDTVSQRSILSAMSYDRYGGGKLVAQYNPLIARYLIENYSPVKNPKVLDPCGGWGGRMVGAYLAGASSYVCLEPELRTAQGLNRLAVHLSDTMSTTVRTCVAEDPYSYLGVLADIVVACPPYYDQEKYPEDPRQSWRKYSSYPTWRLHFLTPMLINARDALKRGGVIAITLGKVKSNDLVEDSRKILIELGMRQIDELLINTSGRSENTYRETILIFKKEK